MKVIVVTRVQQEYNEFDGYPVGVCTDADKAFMAMREDIEERFEGRYDDEDQTKNENDFQQFYEDGLTDRSKNKCLVWEYEDGEIWLRYFFDEKEIDA